MSKPILTARIDDQNPRHTRLSVFNRGGYSGTLVVETKDIDEILRRLSGATLIHQDELAPRRKRGWKGKSHVPGM